MHIDGAQLIPKSLINSGEGLAAPGPHHRRAALQDGRALAEHWLRSRKPVFSDAVHLQGWDRRVGQQMQPYGDEDDTGPIHRWLY